MLFKSLVLFLVFANVFAKEPVLEIPNVEHILDVLAKQEWDAAEVPCRNRIFNILENVKNSTLWATWVWNSIDQSPTGIFMGARYHLGSYDQCLRPPWHATHPELRTQYCLAEIDMNKGGFDTIKQDFDPYVSAEEYYIESRTSFGRTFSYMAYGICLPAGCPSKSAEKFVRALLSTGHLRAAKGAAVSIHHCEEAGATHEYSTGYYAFMYTFAALLFIAVASTYYISEYPVTASSNSFVNHVAKSFDLRRNWGTVFKSDKDELPCLHGIRFLTATIIAYIHNIAILQGTSVSNGIDFERTIESKPVLALGTIHFDVFVDTFFALSALLLAKSLATLDVTAPYSLMKNILKRYVRVCPERRVSWFMWELIYSTALLSPDRLLLQTVNSSTVCNAQLIVPFAVTVFYLAHVSKYTDDGPMYPNVAFVEQQACEKNWWLALLMLGNYFNTSEMCHPATWYIPCDFHLYVITLVLLYVYRKNPRAGKAAAAIVLAIGFVMPGIITYVYDLPAILAYDLGGDVDIRKSPNFNYHYIRTHNRMGPYAVGLAVGYLMSLYKPKDYKKVWSKTVSFLGAYLFLNLMLAVLGLGWMCYLYGVQGFLASIFTTFDRTVFAVSVLGLVIFCVYGDVPLINSFLSWPVFAPLSRISYGLYVIHLLFLYQSSSMRDQMRHHMFLSLINALGLVVVSLSLSLLVWLLAEAPLVNITSRYLNTKAPTKEKVEVARNGIHENGASKPKNM